MFSYCFNVICYYLNINQSGSITATKTSCMEFFCEVSRQGLKTLGKHSSKSVYIAFYVFLSDVWSISPETMRRKGFGKFDLMTPKQRGLRPSGCFCNHN